ncbi:MAG: hypothetical protein Q8P13_00520 [bacterium]|nr:hypothetical protein [bacterium]
MPKKFFLAFLLSFVFLANFFFLVEPSPVQAATDICSWSVTPNAPSLKIDKSALYYVPFPSDDDTSATVNFTYYVDTRLTPQDDEVYPPNIYWDFYDHFQGTPRKMSLRIKTDLTGQETLDNGVILTYKGSATLAGRYLAVKFKGFAAVHYGEHTVTLENPSMDNPASPGGSLKDSISCQTALTISLVSDQKELDVPPVPQTLDAAFGSPTGDCDKVSLGFTSCPTVKGFVQGMLSLFLGLVGGISFLVLLYGGIRLVSSQGDPKALQETRGVITAAITGLLFAIFAVFLLRLIGITVLGLPLG